MRRDRVISAVSSLLGHPLVAATSGLALGVALTFIAYRAVRTVTPEHPEIGVLIVAAFTMARMMLVILALGIYHVVAPEGFLMFWLVLIVTFFAGLIFETVKMSRPYSPRISS
ncbi:MAG: hypothetical protein ISP10_00610 [Aeromicrobium sp.]|nr:hypothetical protein [Aeromicrobium sp.]